MSKRYDWKVIKKVVAQIAHKAGVAEKDADIFSDSLMDADLRGQATHGVSRVNIYIRRIQKGLIDPKAEITFEKKCDSAFAVDAGNGLGQVQANKVLQLLMPIAKARGVAAASIRNSQHFGTLSYYCNKAAQADMILLAMTNSEPAMSPEGGSQPYFGTNPIAASFPTGKGFTLKIDLSTSIVARGKIIAAQKKGEAIPLGWAFDPDGNPTTDAEKALMGTVLTMAGHKGYALALMVDLFSGVLSGAAFGSSIGSMYKEMDRKQNVGHFFCLMSIGAFMDVSDFKRRVDVLIDEIKANRKRSNVDEILIPGEGSFRQVLKNRKQGIPIGSETIRELEALCAEFKIPCNLMEK